MGESVFKVMSVVVDETKKDVHVRNLGLFTALNKVKRGQANVPHKQGQKVFFVADRIALDELDELESTHELYLATGMKGKWIRGDMLTSPLWLKYQHYTLNHNLFSA
jgi:hypothetical protein